MHQSKLELVKNADESHSVIQSHTEILPSLLERVLHLLDYIAILRPLLLIPVWTMLFLGYYKGLDGETLNHISLPLMGNVPIVLRPGNGILITLLLYSMLMGAVYILNQMSDSHTDEINGKLYLVSRGHIKRRNLGIEIGILFSISVIIALLQFPGVYLYLVLLSIVLGVLYSVPPVRLKGRPILDLLANALGFGVVAFAVGWVSSTAPSTRLIFDCLPYVICIAAAFINTTIPDIKGDVQSGDITTGAFLGIRKSCIFSTLLVGMVPFISLILGDYICLTASLLSLPFFIYMTISNWNEQSPKITAITLATKVSLLVLSLLIAVFIPFYFVLLILIILLMKAYYQLRFGISYP
jgi:4-hydroxybenzoate polyprenyltransferase